MVLFKDKYAFFLTFLGKSTFFRCIKRVLDQNYYLRYISQFALFFSLILCLIPLNNLIYMLTWSVFYCKIDGETKKWVRYYEDQKRVSSFRLGYEAQVQSF